MPVTLDAGDAIGPDGVPTRLWRVQCDSFEPGDRLYLFGPSAAAAAQRAVDEYGWIVDWPKVWCPSHGGRRDG